MSRLTEKREKPLTTKWEDVPTSYYKIKGDDTGVAISEIGRLNKLGKLEDLEEQLGCPLEVREQALQQDEIFYVERYQTKMIRVTAMNCGYVNNGECVLNCLANGIWFCLPVKDYKKTWWLRKDKSE